GKVAMFPSNGYNRSGSYILKGSIRGDGLLTIVGYPFDSEVYYLNRPAVWLTKVGEI
ncbi:hypothetical protein PanWU01x14_018970, partial [Parasponia andersonii]